MSEAEIVEQVHALVGKLAPNQESPATPDARILEDLQFHSLALLELAVELEELFGLPPLDETTAGDVVTVADLSRLVVGLVEAQEAS